MSTQTRRILTFLLMASAMLVAGCQGNPDNSAMAVPPTGLTESNASVVYGQGTEIVPERPTNSGGAITQCSVSPPLPPGLVLNPQTCEISGTPTAVTNDMVYTITAGNAGGSDSTRLEIEVKDTAIAPENLGYPDSSVVYVVNQPITPNAPITTGGEITQYSVSPALPSGLSLDAQTGVITGTPATVAAPAVYTVTGSNSVDSVQTQLSIKVGPQIVAPTSLTYSDLVPVYIVGVPIVYDEPQASGGEITQFSVSPPLPAGLSIDTQTGVISGLPTTAGEPVTYTVTGSNRAGSVTAQITIDVNNAVIGEWLPADNLNQGCARQTATLLTDGRVLVAAGIHGRALSAAEVYDAASDTWSTSGSLNQARQYHTATLLPDGRVLVAGGLGNSGGTELASAELYDPAAGTWTPTGSMNQARADHIATLLANGMVLVAGGIDITGAATSSAELYDPATGTWTPTGNMNQARDRPIVARLSDGRVLAAGGSFSSRGQLSSAELYDPAAGTWSPTGSMSQARSLTTATLLPDGKVLVAGGYNGTTLASAELYDPAAGAWSLTGSMNQARYFHTATLLPDGKVVVAGGVGQRSLSSTELYDPVARTWALAGSLSHPRSLHTATLLLNGSVLAAGGVGPGYLSSSELFH